MKPRIKLTETTTPDGGIVGLYERDGAFSISFSGQELMHSQASASETLLGRVTVERLRGSANEHVLIGGLGLGFTLRSALDAVSKDCIVEVAELIPSIVDWNRTFLRKLNGTCLDDPRVHIRIEDVATLIRNASPATYSAIALDVDNGPIAMVAAGNFHLYSATGLQAIKAALTPGGRAVFWSAGPDAKFESRLRKAGFKVKAVPAKVYEGAKRAAYILFVADLIG